MNNKYLLLIYTVSYSSRLRITTYPNSRSAQLIGPNTAARMRYSPIPQAPSSEGLLTSPTDNEWHRVPQRYQGQHLQAPESVSSLGGEEVSMAAANMMALSPEALPESPVRVAAPPNRDHRRQSTNAHPTFVPRLPSMFSYAATLSHTPLSPFLLSPGQRSNESRVQGRSLPSHRVSTIDSLPLTRLSSDGFPENRHDWKRLLQTTPLSSDRGQGQGSSRDIVSGFVHFVGGYFPESPESGLRGAGVSNGNIPSNGGSNIGSNRSAYSQGGVKSTDHHDLLIVAPVDIEGPEIQRHPQHQLGIV